MQKNYPKKLWLLSFIFALPILASWILYHYHACFHFKTLNHGMLVSSPIDVRDVYAQMKTGYQKKWHIIATCDAACEKLEDQLTRVQKALGKDSDRVLVSLNNNPVQLKNAFIKQGNPSFIVTNKIFLADPQGNLFMYYPNTVDPMNVLKDMKRVLEVSQIG